MRFARVATAFDHPSTDVEPLLETTDLDVLQLDYLRPDVLPAKSKPWHSYAPGLLKQLQALHKTLYLNPQLHVITNAGGGDTIACVERVAEFLCEHGNTNFLLTAIRGDNVLEQLDELLADGIKLEDLATGKSFCEQRRPLLSAQVELGGGPIATALDEGSRFIVAGCYDLAAPALGAAVHALHWPWDKTDALARVATAVSLPETTLDIGANGDVAVSTQSMTPVKPALLKQQLQDLAAANLPLVHADIDCDISKLSLTETTSGQHQLSGVTGLAAAEHWLLRLTYEVGYCSEALFECSSEAAESLLRESLPQDVQFQLLQSGESPQRSLLRISCHNKGHKVCENFGAAVACLLIKSQPLPQREQFQLIGAPPQVCREVESIWCPVPREKISVSVDTRPAQEWK